MDEADSILPDRPYDTFLNKNIFLTGATGFLGKIILERLLRLFEVNRIYLLIRDKKGRSGHERLSAMFTSPLFDSVRKSKGEQIFQKCQIVNGDLTKDNLDMILDDIVLLEENVEILIHSAATVKFDEPLKTAIEINTSGPQRIIDLAKGFKSLKAFVYISTAYCHAEEKVVKEKFYKPPADPKHIMNMIKWLTDEQLDAITPTLLNGLPNTYIFSKSLTEEIMAKEMDNLPILVIRPSIVVPILHDPIAGWTDNINGPMGVLIAAGKGVMRSMYGDENAKADFISVDAVADATFCLVAHFLISEENERIFNCCSSNDVSITWGEVIELGKEIAREDYPFDTVLWSPGGRIRKSKFLNTLAVMVYHFLPALLIDILAFCFGYKPFLWKIQKRITTGVKVLEYFTLNEWIFGTENAEKVKNWLNPREFKKYTISAEGVDIKLYFQNCAYAARKYILKEPDENLPRAKRIMKILCCLDKIFSISFKILLVYLFYILIIIPLYFW